jgi:hypothetical protein
MIKPGHKSKSNYWGPYEVIKVAKLVEPVVCHSDEKGEALFNPTLVKLKWEKPPSTDQHEFWFPYWISFAGKEKYGQFAPMIGEKALLELLKDAIKQDFFGQLAETIVEYRKNL